MNNFCKLYSTFLYVELGIVSVLSAGIRTLLLQKYNIYFIYWENLYSGIWKSFVYEKPESWALESRIRFMESGIPLTIRIRNPTKDYNPESKFNSQRLKHSTWNPEFAAWNPESMDCLTWGELLKRALAWIVAGDKLSVSEIQCCYARVTLPTE